MQEGSVMEFVKWWIFLILMFSALAMFVYFYQVGQTNRFESYVASQIERYAGLTSDAVTNIKDENENYYGGRFTVTADTDQLDDEGLSYTTDGDGYTVMIDEMAYGDVLSYTINAEYDIMFLSMFDDDGGNAIFSGLDRDVRGQATIQVRGSAR